MKSGINVSELDAAYNKPKTILVPKPISKEQSGFFKICLNYFWPPVPELIPQAYVGDADHEQLIACFNRNPMKTIAAWLDDLSLEEQHASIYWLITEHPGLISAEKIGELLSEPSNEIYPWHNGLFEYYLNNRFDFKNKGIAESFNEFLKSDFKLPGEAQKIDRVMEGFSKKYLSDNANSTNIKNNDAAYVLSFSMIMLNTDLHNPNISKKMSFDEFSRNLKGVNAGNDFARDFLNDIYNTLKQNKLIWDRTNEVELQAVVEFEQIIALRMKYDSYASRIKFVPFDFSLTPGFNTDKRKRKKIETNDKDEFGHSEDNINEIGVSIKSEQHQEKSEFSDVVNQNGKRKRLT